MKFPPSPLSAVAPADQEHQASIKTALGVRGQSIREGRYQEIEASRHPFSLTVVTTAYPSAATRPEGVHYP
jgi:hypothetical protein